MQAGALTGARLHACVLMRERKQRKNPEKKRRSKDLRTFGTNEQTMGQLQVYNASAGSGKTFSLVREYLVLLLSSPRADAYREILAITFTNKAAWEMKHRILSTLESLSRGQSASGMGEQILEKTGLPPQVLWQRAGEILEAIFNDYSAFSVGTIDSFTTRLVRSFSHELHLPVGFDIVVDADQILRQAVDLLLLRAGSDGELSEMLLDFVLHNVDNGNSWDITSLLLSGARMGQEKAADEALEKLADKKIGDYLTLRRRLLRYLADVEKKVSEVGQKACRIIYQELGSDKIMAGGATGIAGFFRKAAAGNVSALDPNASAVEKFLAGKYASSTATAEQKIAVGAQYQPLCALAEEIASLLETHKKSYGYAQMVLAPLSKMGVASQIGSQVDAIKQRSGVMLLSEFNQIVSRHLRQEPVPFIYEKLGERYKHYFIDEFQDTSTLQWDNIRALVYNQLAQDGSGLVVGDAKQAIYRWRGGDTRQFIDLYQRGGGLPAEQYRVENLTTNYRSGGVIVDFTNEFFTLIAPVALDETFRRVYEEGNHQASKAPGEGFVSIRTLEGRTVEDRREPTLLAILEEIDRVTRLDGYSYRDIAVIYRSNRDGSQIAEYLSAHGIPVQSSESLLIDSSRAVRVLVAALRTLAFPDDLQARATLANYLEEKGAFSAQDPDAEKSRIITSPAAAFFEALEKFSAGKFFHREAQQLPLYECVEYLASGLSLWGQGQDAYLTAFLDLAGQFVRDISASPVALLEEWDTRRATASIPSGEAGNAVSLMTIHKAKGLEFPVTIVPFASWSISDREEVWIDIPEEEKPLEGLPVALVPLSGVKKNGLDQIYAQYQGRILADNLNLLYVALTRAKRQLHILTSTDVPGRTVGEYFGYFLGNVDIVNQDDPQGIYTYSIGQRTPAHEREETTDLFPVERWNGTPWRERLRVNLDWKKVWATPAAEAVERGNRIHQVLSDVTDAQGVDAAVSRALRTGLFPWEEAERISRAVHAVVAHPSLSQYYAAPWQGEAERELKTAQGKVLRPDRVCIDGDRAVVLDYKTGAPRAEHSAQVAEYALVLQNMGYKVEKCLLIYLNDDKIEVQAC